MGTCLLTHTRTNVRVRVPRVCESDARFETKQRKAAPVPVMFATPLPCLLISNAAVFCRSLLSIGALMRRVFVLRTISMVFQSSLLTVLEPSPLLKGEKKKKTNGHQILNVPTAPS